MNNVAIVYWSGTGNTEAMADLIAQGAEAAGATVEIIHCSSFTADQLDNFDAIAFGCPAMGDEELEDLEFLPLYDEIEPLLGDMPTALFGSYDWNNGESGVHVIGNAIAKDYPFDEDAAKCEKLGELLASA